MRKSPVLFIAEEENLPLLDTLRRSFMGSRTTTKPAPTFQQRCGIVHELTRNRQFSRAWLELKRFDPRHGSRIDESDEAPPIVKSQQATLRFMVERLFASMHRRGLVTQIIHPRVARPKPHADGTRVAGWNFAVYLGAWHRNGLDEVGQMVVKICRWDNRNSNALRRARQNAARAN